MPKTRKGNAAALLRGLLAAILFTLAGMLLIAAGLTWLGLSENRISLLNQLLKIAAIILGTCIAVHRGGEKGLATGTLLALAYMALGYALYMVLGGGSFSASGMLGEMLVGSTAGAITGTVRANLSAGSKNKRIRT